jgi:dihydrofolate reductase
MKNNISIIAGVQIPNHGLGIDGDLLYKLTADMKRFKELTDGHIVIMGRKTWESIPAQFRPLPNRHNIVLTRDTAYDAPGAEVFGTFAEAIQDCADSDAQIFLIGGARVYEDGLRYADTLYLTEFSGDKPADTFFPDYSNFGEEVNREEFTDKKTGLRFDFVTITSSRT